MYRLVIWLVRGKKSACVPYCAMTSLPFTIGLIALCWIADGFSKPKDINGRLDLEQMYEKDIHQPSSPVFSIDIIDAYCHFKDVKQHT